MSERVPNGGRPFFHELHRERAGSSFEALRNALESLLMDEIMKSFVWPMLAAFVALSLIAVVGWFQFRKQHLHTLRMDLFSELMGARYNLTGDAFSTALNRAGVVP